MGPCHHCRAEKGEPEGAVQVPRCTNPWQFRKCDKFGQKTKETSWPDTDYRSSFTCKSLNMLLLLQGTSGTELGGAAVPCNFDRRML
jgi:hypothetical protein